jgi:D-beta-D-heptose 7-phosphate kinase/D-beta-D-heptose 1-phosphate adenosyltransferase
MVENDNRPVEELAGVKVLVLGDVMLDRYLQGQMGRISPEAPVPVVTLSHETYGLGGAGHVAASIAALGGEVTLAAIVGQDDDAQRIRQAARDAHVVNLELFASPQVRTISKTRVVAGKFQQILRLDYDGSPAALEAEAELRIGHWSELAARHDVVVLSDYEKGNLTQRVLSEVIVACRKAGKLCLVDPKKTAAQAYRGATLLTPNLLEAQRMVGRTLDSLAAVERAAIELRASLDLTYMVITCGADGMVVADTTGTTHIPAEVREVADVTGAGDTVVSVLAMALGRGWDVVQSGRLASLAAGIAVSKPRAYIVKAAELSQIWRGGSIKILDVETARRRVAEARHAGHTVVFTNGCFDVLHAGHLSCLERARKLGDLLVLGLNSDRSVRVIKGPGRPAISEQYRAALLAGLACVDIVVIFDEDTPEHLLEALEPDVLVKGASSSNERVVGAAIVEARGGRVVTLPQLEGLSSSGILKSASSASDAQG